jgi:hypothetical protein
MKNFSLLLMVFFVLVSCSPKKTAEVPAKTGPDVTGTWKLLTGTLIADGDTTITDYTGSVSFIKIINQDHFAFLQHDLKTGKDSLKLFVAGGGAYDLKDSIYTEHLEYCSDRVWEGNDFSFVVTLRNDTLVLRGIEKVAEAKVDRLNEEKYVRVSGPAKKE